MVVDSGFQGNNSIFQAGANWTLSDSTPSTVGMVFRANSTGTYVFVHWNGGNTVTWVAGAVGDWYNIPCRYALQTGASVTGSTHLVGHYNLNPNV